MLVNEQRKNRHTLAEDYLDVACENLPVVNRTVREYGDVSLLDYLKIFFIKAKPSYQQRDDFLKVIYQYAAPLLGKSIAQQAVRDLEPYPVALTCNHLGVEYYSQFIQSNLIFSLNTIARNASTATMPVFSFGNVSLNNFTYPRGVLLYHVNHRELDSLPVRLPVFPDRLKRQSASIVKSFDDTMIRRAEVGVDKMVHYKLLPHALADVMHEIFEKDYCLDSVMALSNYSQQTTVLNNRIWKRLFSETVTPPKLLYLEFEKIASMLLKTDLSNPESLVWRVMFEPTLRRHILDELDGVRGCWWQKRLVQRLHTDLLDKKQRNLLKSCGTIFFWGIDNSGRRIPFYLETDNLNNEVLRGIDDRGKVWKLRYAPQIIINELFENRLIPSLFTCFLTLSFARGIACVGGYFQSEYLPLMQQGVVAALQKTTGYSDAAHLVSQVSTDCYLSGMLAVMSRINNDCLVPSGTAEIIAGGGLSDNDIEKMLSLTVRDAHIAGLFEMILDAIPPELRPLGWKKQLATDCFRLLEGKVVIK